MPAPFPPCQLSLVFLTPCVLHSSFLTVFSRNSTEVHLRSLLPLSCLEMSDDFGILSLGQAPLQFI